MSTTLAHDEVPELPGYVKLRSGKVRDLWAPIDPATDAPRDDQVLLVASDRISAFDHVLDTTIPDKGVLLTRMSLWWFDRLSDLVPNHVISTEVPLPVAGRAVLVERLDMLPVECIAREYLTGSGLADYRATGSVNGIRLPSGLSDGARLPEVIFTPSTKAEVGEHDEPMTAAEVEDKIGPQLARAASRLTREILGRANEIASHRGILIADTKVEFGQRVGAGAEPGLVLADEVLTPDSSRFWPADQWRPGRAQPSFDKQYVRDWLLSPESGWDRDSEEPPPALPWEVVQATRDRYVEAYERLTGETF